jgi:hypothetical protein
MTNIRKHWRTLACETRILAGNMADPETKRLLLEIAVGYDRLAELAETREGVAKKSS